MVNIDATAKLVDALSHVISAVAWPLTIVVLALRFAPAIRDFIRNIGELSFKAGGLEAAAKAKERVEAALSAAEASKDTPRPAPLSDQAKQAVARALNRTFLPRTLRRAKRSSILWVDDNPDNNIFARTAFEDIGIEITQATSTEEALALAQSNEFDAIISDMGRPPDMRAGYTLLSKLGPRHPPYAIFSASSDPQHDQEAKSKGALGSTNSASRLFEIVVKAIAEGGR